jgi:hypothetical protein
MLLLLICQCWSVQLQHNSLENCYFHSVKVETEYCYGSGFEGRFRGFRGVLTAAHVVEGCKKCWVVSDHCDNGLVRREATVKLVDSELDLAFLEVAGLPVDNLPLLEPADEVELGESVWYSTYGSTSPCWLEQAVISRTHFHNQSLSDGIVVTGKAWYGSSGGAILVKRGSKYVICGVVHGSSADSSDCYPFSPCSCVGPKSIKNFLNRLK